MDCGHEADDQVILNGNCDMVSRVSEEHSGHVFVNRIIKNIRCNIHENVQIITM